ncbi:MAG TPA: DNA polymerase III subunit alpha [Chloroflexota bacterium]|nr:DNA polymerase III subunit alpha [Chloroflexota bacterium]
MTVADPLENVRAWWDEDAEGDLQAYDPVEDEPAPAGPEPPPAEPTHDFVHLHVHSEFSLLDGLSPVRHVVDAVKRTGMRAVALTDHGNMYGAVDFYSHAKAAGIKPILGVETYVSPRGMSDKVGNQDRNYFHLVLLAKNLEGYHNLIKLVSRASLEGYYYKPRIDRALLAEHAAGLIALSACYSGEPSRAILDSDPNRAREAAGWYREVFGRDYYLELQDHGNPDDQVVNAGLLELHQQLGIPLVVTNDTHYALQHQAPAQDILLCIQTNSNFEDPKRMRMQPEAFYLKSPAEMWQLFGHLPDALRNTVAIAEQCDVQLEFGRLSFPTLDHLVPAGQTPQEFLTRTCNEGLVRRYGAGLTAEHRQRLQYELEVVEKTGFAAYILFVWDFVAWARQRGIPCGPRGSAAGSIIVYCLGIADLDPVKYGIAFERFLNPERIQMPDIDMDFADDRRDEVIQYVIDKYGSDRVAQIITFGRLQARAAIRDVGRALDLPLNEVDRVAKLIPQIPIGLKIADALEQSQELKTLYDGQPHIQRLIKTAQSVEGVARNAGTHAAGVVVADQPLINYVPLQRATRGESAMTQYDMKVLDKIGLLKMDFLGLANLTMLSKALDNVKARTGIELDLARLPLDDATTYAMLSRGETRTVFQLEGGGMTRSVQELQPSTLGHLAALVALYRPGPMAHIPSYIARRDGREPPVPPDPSLADVLEETYGIIVYQDQVLEVVRKLAGYSLGQADVLRRAMGKKDREVMAHEGPKFMQAVLSHGYSANTAERVWELLQPFAGYAFGKAHAYCYALVAYQTAYFKANYPAEWFAAVLSTIAGDTEKVVGVVGECRRVGVALLPPDVNASALAFRVEASGGIRFGLAAVKNVGEGAVEQIVSERLASGPYTSLEEFCRRQDLHTINKRVIESLAKCGALDALGQREALLDSKRLDSAIAAAQIDQKAASTGQVSLFDLVGGVESLAPKPVVAAVPLDAASGPSQSRERALWEKEVLGFQFGDHPFMQAAAWLANDLSHDTSQLTAELSGERVKIAGLVTGVRRIVTKTKSQMAVLTLEDLHGTIEAVVFPRVYERGIELWREDAILIVEGKVDTRSDRPQLVVDRADEWSGPPHGKTAPPLRLGPAASDGVPRQPANGTHVVGQAGPTAANVGASSGGGPNVGASSGVAREDGPLPAPAPARRVLRVVIPRGEDDNACVRVLEQLHGLVERFPGSDEIRLVLHDRSGGRIELAGTDILVRDTPDLESQVRTLVGAENLVVDSSATDGSLVRR